MSNDNLQINGQDHGKYAILKSILRMGLPSMIGFGIGNIYDLIDAYWLSRLGPEPVASITILNPVLMVVGATNMAVGSGSVAIISRRYGEGDLAETEMAIKETVILKWIVALLFGLLGFICTPFLLRLLGAIGDVLDMGITYGRIIFVGLGFNFATYSVFTALRGVANPQKAMFLMLFLSGLNMILDPFMIFGWWIFPRMGVAGAAWATNIAYALAFTIGMAMFYLGGANVRLRWQKGMHARWQMMWKMVKIGIPSAIGSVSFSLARLVIMPMITVFGVGVIAAYGVGQRVTGLGITLLVGIGLGLSALIGHNLGGQDKERAKKTANQAILLSIAIMTFMALITGIFADWIMRQFFTEQDIISYGVIVMRVFALGLPFLGLQLALENIYTGVGENRPTMMVNILGAWILEVPAIYLFTQVLGLNQNAVWWSLTGAVIVSATVFYMYFRNGKWLHVKV